jgi:uncharacterized repeat protein (TIGR01451 family)
MTRIARGVLARSVLAAAVGLGPTAATAQAVKLMSRSAVGSESAAVGGGSVSSVSADGRWVAFTSPGLMVVGQIDRNNQDDVFLKDRQTGETSLVSHVPGSTVTTGSAGTVGIAHCGFGFICVQPLVSANGQYVLFGSLAGDLVPGFEASPQQAGQLFLWSRADGAVTLVSHKRGRPATAADDWPLGAAISADGAFVAFYSAASDLTAGGDTNGTPDVFLWSRADGTIRLVSHALGSPDAAPSDARPWQSSSNARLAISPDGRTVAYSTAATGLTGPNEGSQNFDVFLYDGAVGLNTLVSGGLGGDSVSLSADGQRIAFVRTGSGNDPTIGMCCDQVLLWQRGSGNTVIVSHSPGNPGVNGALSAYDPHLSADGSSVSFWGSGTLVAGAASTSGEDVFRYSTANGVITLVSHLVGSLTTPANGGSRSPRPSADGSRIVFVSKANDLVNFDDPAASGGQVYLYSALDGSVERVSIGYLSGGRPNGDVDFFFGEEALSANGGIVVFGSAATDLTPLRDTDGQMDVFARDTAARTTDLITRRPDVPRSASSEGGSYATSSSGDDRYSVFLGSASDLVPGVTDRNGGYDAFLYDRDTGEVTLVSHAAGDKLRTGNGAVDDLFGTSPVISADGNWVSFASRATDHVAGQDANGMSDLFLWSRADGSIRLVSHAPGGLTTAATGAFIRRGSGAPALSADGRFVAFLSDEDALVVHAPSPSNGAWQAYVFARDTGTVVLASHIAGDPTRGAFSGLFPPLALSADGRFLAFSSNSNDLLASDANGKADVFLFDFATGLVQLVSHSAGGTGSASGESSGPVISADGSAVAFISTAPNLVPGQVDSNAGLDAFLWSRTSGEILLVSHAVGSSNRTGNAASGAGPFGIPGPGLGLPIALSADGSWVAFLSQATDLVAGMEVPEPWLGGVFQFSRATGETAVVSHASGLPRQPVSGMTGLSALSADGRFVLFTSDATGLTAASDSNQRSDLFLQDRRADRATLVSVSTAGAAAGIPSYGYPASLSSDGRFVAFSSDAIDLVLGDGNGRMDAFLFGPASPGAEIVVGAIGPPAAVPGTTVTYALTVFNAGPEAADNAILEVTPPAGFALSWVAGACSALPCALGSIPVSASRVVALAFRIPSALPAGPAVLGARVQSSTGDPYPADNVTSTTVALTPQADLVLGLSAPSHTFRGSPFTYTVDVTNAGPSDATNVALSDPTPTGVDSLAVGTPCVGGFPCVLPTIRAGETVTVRVTEQVSFAYSGPETLVAHAALTTVTPDPNPGNEQALRVTLLESPSGPLAFYTLSPCRLMDTRGNGAPLGGPALAPGSAREVPAGGRCGIPPTAKALSVTIVAVTPSVAGYLSFEATGAAPSDASLLNYATGKTRAGNAVLKLNSLASATAHCSQAGGSVHVIIDVNGYFE